MQPITFASSTLAGAGTGELNGAGSAFCAAFNRVAQKFPFSPSSRMDATVSDLNELIKPGSGKFWKFYEEKLASVIMRNADGTFIAQPGGAVPIRAEFTRFLTQVGQLADGLYSNGASDPRLDFTVSVNSFSKTNTQVSFGVDSHVQQFSVASASVGSGEFTWSLQSARQAQLRADFASGDLEVTENGPWALYRLFFTASAWSGRGSRTVVEWTVTPQGQPMPEPLRMQLSLPDAPNVLRKDFYGSGIRCVSRVAD
jgi:type VI protein secretion system component VasK